MAYLDTEILDELLEILGNDDLCAIAQSFADQLDRQLAALGDVSGSDLTETARIAHSLKGGAGNLGAHALSEVAATLERSARDGDSAKASAVMASLPDIAHRTLAELKARGYLLSPS